MSFPTVSAPQGVCVAYGADAYDASPTWSRLDTSRPDLLLQQVQVRRGRTYMTDQTGAGTVAVTFTDQAGLLDPTNSAGPVYPMNPNCPFAVALLDQYKESVDPGNPANWTTIFTGMVQSIPTSLDTSAKFSTGTLNAADMLALLAIGEIPPGLDFDSSDTGSSTANTIGDTTYAEQGVQARIKAVLADAGVPAGLTNIFSGNVTVQACVEPAGTTQLEMIENAADAEFPTVRNIFVSKTGVVDFRGRLARFNPTDPSYDINIWHVGDAAAVAAHSSWASVAGLSFDRDVTKVINDATLTPYGIADADIPTLEVSDAPSIGQYGLRAYSGTALLTAADDLGNDANDAVKLFNQYLVENFKDAQTRITQLTFTNPASGAANAEAQWLFLCGVEISDLIYVTTSHPGGGGFSDEPYFVEGVTYTLSSLRGDEWLVQLTLDLSPQAYFTSNPFS